MGEGSWALLANFCIQRKVNDEKAGQEGRREGRRSLGNWRRTNRKKEIRTCRKGI